MTKLFEPNEEGLSQAAELVRLGGTVVFPTETVYGLGANAFLPQAVEKIFRAKGRPQDNPLIVHIHDFEQIKDWELPPISKKLADAFWPGPLTMIVKKNKIIPDVVTAGLDTVGIRIPSDLTALQFLKYANVPVAAPSANISGRPSPTCFEHVYRDLFGRVDGIIKGEPSVIGLESTIIKVDEGTPTLLRPGGITLEELTDTIGEVKIGQGVFETLKAGETAAAPGMKYKHYAPRGQLMIINGQPHQVADYMNKKIKENACKSVGILVYNDIFDIINPCGLCLSMGDRHNPTEGASRLFSHLRKFDKEGIELIYAQGNDIKGIGLALSNRLNKSAGFRMIDLDKDC